MIYCKKCLIPNTRPNGQFNDQGVCSPCQSAALDRDANFEHRLNELKSIIRKYLSHKKMRWQCVVGVSGGKDSTRQALWVREKLGVNPLLVSVAYPPRQISNVGVNNLSNLIRLGFDTQVLGPAPVLSRKLVREAFLGFANWAKATEMALFAGVPRVAINKGVPLIFWGENPALFVGDSATIGSSIWDGNNLLNSNTLNGGDLTWFKKVAGSEDFLNMYRYPSSAEIKRNGLQTIFLGPAWKDWSNETNSRISLAHGLSFRDINGDFTGDHLGTSMIDEDWFIVNMIIKYYKFGFSRATEYANIEIRKGANRESFIPFIERYDSACDNRYIESFCKYIDITSDDFWATVRRFASPKLFDLRGKRPVKKFKVGIGLAND
jgi:N-acetyl sugar amidotransferase